MHTTSSEVAEAFRPVEPAFRKLMRRGAGGGALVVRLRGETVVDLVTGSTDAAGTKPWTQDTLGISFSTTKGVASTVVHRLADRGLLGHEDPVAAHWPAFGAGGKDRLTVRELMSHRGNLHSIRAVADRAEDILDHALMEERLAARTVRTPTAGSAYHAITYGWLLSGLVRSVTGKGMGELVDEELVKPLGLDGGLNIGAPGRAQERVAEPVGSALRHLGSTAQVMAPIWTKSLRAKSAIDALHLPGFHRLFEGARPPIWTAEMPAVNGAFSATALAHLYGAIANGGEDGGRRLLSSQLVDDIGRVQVRTADRVLGLKMRWRTGYHQAFGADLSAPRAFGHYGYGGSGGWADPTIGLSVGFVTNRIGSFSTPMGDLTLMRLNKVVRQCAARVKG